MSEEDKKIPASELLLAINNRLIVLEKTAKLQTMQYTLILDRLNKLLAADSNHKQTTHPIVALEKKPPPAQMVKVEAVDAIDTKEIEQVKPAFVSKPPIYSDESVDLRGKAPIKFESKKTNKIESEEETDVVDAFVNNIIGEKKDALEALKNAAKVTPVTQVVLFRGNPVIAADVSIIDLNTNNVVNATKTSTAGRWQVMLKTGKYTMKFYAKHMGKTLGYSQTFEIPEGNSKPIEIPAPKIIKEIT